MSQPEWECVAQIGDRNPLEHGGFWVFRDKTGVYDPEGEFLDVPEEGETGYRVYRFSLTPCTHINGVLSDNKHHPEHPAWFAKPESERAKRPQDSTYLKNVADFVSMDVGELIQLLCSDNPMLLAVAYEAVGQYHGFENLDTEPLVLTRAGIKARYTPEKYPNLS